MTYIPLANRKCLVLEALVPQILAAVQKVYDEWQQDQTGFDEVVGYGGICNLIADAIADVIADDETYECVISGDNEFNHTFLFAYNEDNEEVWFVDIHYSWYETGGGYTWKKIPDVVFTRECLTIRAENYDEFKRNYLEAEGDY